MTSITNSFNIININHFLIYNCEDTYLLNNLSSIVKEKIRRIYTFSGSNNSNILRWTPNDAFSQFSSLQPNKLYWVESLASNFTPYVLLEECVAIPPDPTTTPTSTPTPTLTPTPTPTPPPTGNNSANYNSQAVWGGVAHVTKVGSNGGPSAYGTYDQSGNVFEWTNSRDPISASTAKRGGGWNTSSFVISKSFREVVNGDNEYDHTGFRIASDINPSSLPNFVLVEDSSNSADTTGYGQVGYNYRICSYAVTNCEYTEFLNIVAKFDTEGDRLYDVNMDITKSGSNGSYTYSVKDNYENKPVVYVSWWSAARYCNWLHNRVANPSTTSISNGAYGVGSSTAGILPSKSSSAWYWLPTENEWYKAAYYKSGGIDAGYWLYATQSDTAPTPVTASFLGNGLINGQPANDSDYVCT